MKTIRLLVLTATLAGSALIGTAGPTSQLSLPGGKSGAAPKSSAPTALVCSACKDESVRVTRFVGPVNRQHTQSVEVARKHSCPACGAVVATSLNCPNEKIPGMRCCGRARS